MTEYYTQIIYRCVGHVSNSINETNNFGVFLWCLGNHCPIIKLYNDTYKIAIRLCLSLGDNIYIYIHIYIYTNKITSITKLLICFTEHDIFSTHFISREMCMHHGPCCSDQMTNDVTHIHQDYFTRSTATLKQHWGICFDSRWILNDNTMKYYDREIQQS